MNNIKFACCFLLLCFYGNAQQIPTILQYHIEFWMEKHTSDNLDLTQLQENWEYYLEHPLNLNSASKEEFSQLDLLTDLQINEVILHREKLGKFLSLYELQTLTTWDSSLIQLILPFIQIDDLSEQPPLTWYELSRNGKFEGLTRIQHPMEQTKNDYLGNSDYYLTKIRYTYQQRISIGLTAEKDAGEPFLKHVNKNGFDFYSFHANIKGGKYLKNVLIGDYHIQVGQGLNCWTSFALGKTLELTTSKKNAKFIRPHTSTDENRFFRGTALDFSYRKFSLLLFNSYNKKDALIDDSLHQTSSFLVAGYHRTISEIDRKDKLKEKVIGSYLRYDIGTFHLGIASIYTQLSSFYNKKTNSYNQFDFRGDNLLSSSVDYSYSIKNVLLFGEYVYVDFSRKSAFLSGVMLALDSKTSLSVVYRNYDKAYQTFYNAGFSEGNSVQNEKGVYLAISIKPMSSWNIQAYFDVFQYPWLKYQVNLPSKGLEQMLQLTYKPNKKLESYFRFRVQMKEQNTTRLSEGLDQLVSVYQNNIRFNFTYQLNNSWLLRSRIEGVEVLREDKYKEMGMLFYQDVGYEFSSKKMECIARFVLFDTDSYATRIYSYESNPSYQYSSLAFFGKGTKAYVLVRCSLWRKLDCWLKFGLTTTFQQTIVAALDPILSNAKREINLQFRWSL